MSPLEYLLDYCRSCPSCGTNFGVISWLCESCLQKLHRRLRDEKQSCVLLNNSLSIYFLFSWQGDDPFIQSLVYSLKGGKLPRSFDFLAENFLLKHHFHRLKPEIYYPSKGPRDHASSWAQSLATLTGANHRPLELVLATKQSLLNRGERKKVSFKSEKALKDSYVIFADDIVTTGATAIAAWKSLGQPKSFAIWSLFYRRDL